MPSFSWTSVFTNESLTRNDFITNFRARVDEDLADIISDAQIIELIRQGNHDIAFRTKLLPEYATVSLDGSESYTLPTDMSELYEVYYVNTATPPLYQQVLPSNQEELGMEGYSVDLPTHYVREGQNLRLFGSSATTGSIKIYGARNPTFPATGLNYIDLPDQYLELMFLWCEWKYFGRRRELDEANLKRDLYFEMCARVEIQVKEQYSRGLKVYG